MKREALERALGHRFARPALLEQALTHRSFGAAHNERLEFLGDAVLDCVVSRLLYERYDGLREGELSRLRAGLVRQDALHRIATRLGLGECLRLGEGEARSGGASRPSILGDAMEAVLGAVFLDGGFGAASAVIERLYGPMLAELDPESPGKDPKTRLQELLQARRHELPRYMLRATHGQAHAQRFEIECVVPQPGIAAIGTGASRRAAEQEAARRALELLERT
ncbi:MAG: ribonuclease III [Rhodocyclaceae bacterium]